MRCRHGLCELDDLPHFKCHLLTGDEGDSKGDQTGKLFRVGLKKPQQTMLVYLSMITGKSRKSDSTCSR